MASTSRFLVLPLVLVSCAAPAEWENYRQSLPEDKRAYMEKVDAMGPSGRVAAKDVETAWKRAEEFLATHAGGVEKDPVRTTRMKSTGGAYAYTIDIKKGMSDHDVSVVCAHSSKGSTEEAWRNARIAKYYIVTGELPFPDLVSK